MSTSLFFSKSNQIYDKYNIRRKKTLLSSLNSPRMPDNDVIFFNQISETMSSLFLINIGLLIGIGRNNFGPLTYTHVCN